MIATSQDIAIDDGDLFPWGGWRREPEPEAVRAWPAEATLRGVETVLIVDDEPIMREVISDILQRFGYRVMEASGALEAQQLLGTELTVDLLITDVFMPGMNGMELAHWFLGKRPESKVLLITGSLDLANRMVKPDGVDFLAKPFDGLQLSRKVRLVLG